MRFNSYIGTFAMVCLTANNVDAIKIDSEVETEAEAEIIIDLLSGAVFGGLFAISDLVSEKWDRS